MGIVREKVKTERDKLSGNTTAEGRKKKWYLYGRDAKALYHAIGRGASFAKHPAGWNGDDVSAVDRVIAVSLVQTYLKFEYVSNQSVFAHRLAIILPDGVKFAILSSTIFQEWARKTSSTMGYGINFSPSDSYETFPFPLSQSPQPDQEKELAAGGHLLHIIRQSIMRDRHYGLTQLYNDFHNPQNEVGGILRMRDVQKSLDYAMLAAYGWNGINLEHDFYPLPYLSPNDNIRYTISESARIEILRRLAQLNRQRWQEEQEAEK